MNIVLLAVFGVEYCECRPSSFFHLRVMSNIYTCFRVNIPSYWFWILNICVRCKLAWWLYFKHPNTVPKMHYSPSMSNISLYSLQGVVCTYVVLLFVYKLKDEVFWFAFVKIKQNQKKKKKKIRENEVCTREHFYIFLASPKYSIIMQYRECLITMRWWDRWSANFSFPIFLLLFSFLFYKAYKMNTNSFNFFLYLFFCLYLNVYEYVCIRIHVCMFMKDKG